MAKNKTRKLCIMIHETPEDPTASGQKESTTEYVLKNLKEGATVIHFPMHSSSWTLDPNFSEVLPKHLKRFGAKKSLLRNFFQIYPKPSMRSDFYEAYSERSFLRILNSLKLKPDEKLDVELIGGTATVCFKSLSKPIAEKVVSHFGNNRAIVRTKHTHVYGSEHKPKRFKVVRPEPTRISRAINTLKRAVRRY